MADELNVPTHRWYEPRNNIALPPNVVSPKYILANGVAMIDAWINSQPWGMPLYLFAASEPGWLYDNSDMSTLFQDSAGTTPVTDVGQPVGLQLDKSKGLVLGPELVTNGDFSAGNTGWTRSLPTWDAASGKMANDGTNSSSTASVQQVGLVSAGKTYRIVFDLVCTSGSANLWLGGSQLVKANISASGRLSYTVLASVTGSLLFEANISSVVSLDNISVKELAGTHRTQTTAASCPTFARLPVTGRRNLLTYTEQFDNDIWAKGGVTVSANTALAPDGASTAEKMVEDTSTGAHRVLNAVGVTVTSGATYTWSVFAKAAERTVVRVTNNNLAGATFDLSNNAAASNVSAGITAAAVAVGNGWFRLSVTGVAVTSTERLVAQTVVGGDTSYTGDGTSGVLIWGAQLELGSTATNYQAVTSIYDITEAGVQTAYGLYYDGVDDWLVTPTITPNLATSDGAARRNLLLYPSAFEDSEWAKGGTTISANTSVAPDGTTTADKMAEDGTTGVHRVLTSAGITVVSGSSYVWSVYAKAAERTVVRVSNNSLAGATFDLGNSGATSSVSGGITATATSVGDGWFRLSISTTAATTIERIVVQTVVGGNTSYTGTVGSGILLWGAQLELGTTATAFQNIGTDKVQVFAGVRKLSDATLGTLVELSTVFTNPGSFAFTVPNSVGSPSVAFISTGTEISAVSSGGIAAPTTKVLTGLGDISGDRATLRVNGTQVDQSTADQGTGNYLAYPAYFGRRGGTTLPFSGYTFREIGRFGPNLDAATLANVENWINQATGAY